MTCGIVGLDQSRETKGFLSKSIGQQQAVEKTSMGAEPETIIDAAESEFAEPETVIGVESENADSEAVIGQNGYAVSVNAEPETIIDVGV